MKDHRSVLFITALFLLMSGSHLQAADFARIDNHADNTPRQVEKSIHRLASYLTESVENDYEKARAIYRWLAMNISYDTEGLFSGKLGDLSPEGVLQSRRAVCSGYSGLFRALGQAAGLEVVEISGYSKGYAYKVGATLTRVNHAWNAIRIKGGWYLLDSTWGAGHLNGAHRFVRSFNDHYFLTPPAEFIYDHLPEEPAWQLLDAPVSKPEFQSFPYLKAPFFQTGLELKSHRQGVFVVEDRLEVVLGAPAATVVMARLEKDDRELDRSLVFVQKIGDGFRIAVVFPGPGTYVLRVYAKPVDAPGSYLWALDYRIDVALGRGVTAGFPARYQAYDDNGSIMVAPLKGKLKSGREYRFKILVPQARKVFVQVGQEKFYLDKDGDVFSGMVVVGRGDINVGAFFTETTWSGLLKYTGF